MYVATIRSLSVALAITAVGSQVASFAAETPITWQTPVSVNPTDPTQALTNGTFFAAGAFGGPLAVNGINFSGPTAVTGGYTYGTDIAVGNVTSSSSGFGQYNPSSLGFNTYQQMLNGGTYTHEPALQQVTISNLSPGNLYQVQIWAPSWNHDWTSTVSDTLGNASGVLHTGSNPSFVVGTFTAGSTGTEIINGLAIVNAGDGYSILSGISVQTLQFVPEPTSVAMGTIACVVGMLAAVRHRHKSQR